MNNITQDLYFKQSVVEYSLIEFNRGAIYQYHGVPEERYLALLSSSSCGTYFHQFIKPYYSAIRIS